MTPRLLAAAVLLAALAAGCWWLHHRGYEAGRAEVTAEWARAQSAYDAAVRQREDEWSAARQAAATQRQEENKDAAAAIARVNADRDRLRGALKDAIGRLDAENRGAPGGAGDTGAVLADVCSRAGEAAAVLAAYADRERASRRECQSAWPRGE